MAMHRWLLPELQKDAACALAEECEIQPFLALLLTTRGITTVDEALSFLVGGEEDDPFSLVDMDLAVERIERAIDTGESVMIYGDYDVDGVTATALLFEYLKSRGANVAYRLPTREGDGYGLHTGAVDDFAAAGVSLLITVDNGITAVEAVERANAAGIDVVVTDHHKPQETLPSAVAVVDPHRADCQSGCTGYAGVSIAYLLCCALEGDADVIMERYGDLLALGMLADVMPLVGAGRTLVRRGLAVLNHLRRPGLRALCALAGMADKELTATRVVFSLAPRLNAAGRMDDPRISAALLLETDKEKADILAETVHTLNTKRQETELHILAEIDKRLQEDPALAADRVPVIVGENWATGVVGILAARLTERFGKPCIVLSTDGDTAHGSGRSLEGFSLFDALSACSDRLLTFGGHALAAGLSLKTEGIADFRRAINAYAAGHFPQMPIPELRLDFKLRPSEIDSEKLALLSALEPFGAGNPTPVFGLFGMRLDNITPIGGGKHLRLTFSKNGTKLAVLKFHTEQAAFPVACGTVCDLAVTLEKNVYKGVVSPTVLLRDIRFADVDAAPFLAATQDFDAVLRQEKKAPLPERAAMGSLYRFLVQRGGFVGTLDALWYSVGDKELSPLSVRLALELWREAGLVSLKDTGNELCITLLPAAGKSDLSATPLWQYLQ